MADLQDKKAAEAAERIAALWSPCPNGTGHAWWFDIGKCIHCGKPYPYAADAMDTSHDR